MRSDPWGNRSRQNTVPNTVPPSRQRSPKSSVVSIPSEGFKSWYGHFEGIFSCCYTAEGELTFIARKALLNVLVLGSRETDRSMKHCVTLRVSDMPLNADTLRDSGVRESTEAGEKKNAPAQCSTGRTNFRGTDQVTCSKTALQDSSISNFHKASIPVPSPPGSPSLRLPAKVRIAIPMRCTPLR